MITSHSPNLISVHVRSPRALTSLYLQHHCSPHHPCLVHLLDYPSQKSGSSLQQRGGNACEVLWKGSVVYICNSITETRVSPYHHCMAAIRPVSFACNFYTATLSLWTSRSSYTVTYQLSWPTNGTGITCSCVSVADCGKVGDSCRARGCWSVSTGVPLMASVDRLINTIIARIIVTFWYWSIEESFLYTKICYIGSKTLYLPSYDSKKPAV